MARTQAQDKWDAQNMRYLSVKVRRELLDSFKAACAERGDTVNGVLRRSMERYVNSSTDTTKPPTETQTTV